MVKAVNEAGETQSIADFIILEATPEHTVDIVNSVSVESTEGQRVCAKKTYLHIKNYSNAIFISRLYSPEKQTLQIGVFYKKNQSFYKSRYLYIHLYM